MCHAVAAQSRGLFEAHRFTLPIREADLELIRARGQRGGRFLSTSPTEEFGLVAPLPHESSERLRHVTPRLGRRLTATVVSTLARTAYGAPQGQERAQSDERGHHRLAGRTPGVSRC